MEPPPSPIESFAEDEEGQWVARLRCGHRQHVRHDPPWHDRAWVLEAEGREAKVGMSLPCRWCLMPALPEDVEAYQQTPVFAAETTPKGLLRRHTTKAGTWAEIVVEAGRVHYVLEDADDLTFVLTTSQSGIVAPGRPHHVKPQRGARFFVCFLREAEKGNPVSQKA